MPWGETNELTPGHTRRRVRGHEKAVHWDRGTRGSEVPLLRCSRRGHSPRAHLSQSRGAGKSTPTARHAMPRTLKRLRVPHQVESGEPFTADRNLGMGIVVRRRRGSLRDGPKREYRETPLLLNVTHADPQAQKHLRVGSADQDGSTASISEACKRQHHARLGLYPLTNGVTNLPR